MIIHFDACPRSRRSEITGTFTTGGYRIDKLNPIGCGSAVAFSDKHIRGPYWDSGGSVSLH